MPVAVEDAAAAQQAFLGASRVVRQDANLTDSAVAEGMALLIQKSPGLTYKPKNGGEPIDIVDPESRKVALAALYADLLAANQAGIDKAMKDTSLKPMHDLLPMVTDLYALEVAATGHATKTEDMAKAMGQHARDLINAELGRLSAASRRSKTSPMSPPIRARDATLNTRVAV